MANAQYDNAVHLQLVDNGAVHAIVDWEDGDIKCTATDHADNTPNISTDIDYDDLDGPEEVAVSANLTCTVASRAVDIVDFVFSAVSGDQFESVTFFMDSGTPATSPLAVLIDTATGLPLTPNGADINVIIDPSGLFSL